jgi:uncharacterized protein
MQSNPKMKDFVINLLDNKLNEFYYFHNAKHALYVMDKATEIAQHQNCTAAEIELVRVAALWHDAGFINIYDGHEEEGCKLVEKYLPDFGYAAGSIKIICGMIMATKIPQSPQNKLEQIIADADLEYLGTANAAAIANELFKERKFLNPLLTADQWNQMQISFLQKHQYFTKFCKENKEHIKQSYLKKLVNNQV